MGLGAAAILLACVGTMACTYGATCNCILSSAASKFAYVIGSSDSVAAFTITPGTGILVPVSGSPFGAGGTPMFGAADPAGKFLYVADPGTQHVFAFNIDQTTGVLTAVTGSPFHLRASQARVPIVDPSGGFLYVTHQDNCGDNCKGAISAFKINTDGSLLELDSSPYQTEYGTIGIAISSSAGGEFLYAMNGRNCCTTSANISGFKINTTNGALASVTGSPFSVNAEAIPLYATAHPNGKFLYLTLSTGPSGTGGVEVFSIDPTSGVPTGIGGAPLATGMNPQGIDLDAIDNFLFVANEGNPAPTGSISGSISAYRIDVTAGTLTAALGSPFATAGSNPFQLAVDRSCKFLYVTNAEGGRGSAFDYVLGFTVDPLSGDVVAVTGSQFSTAPSGPPGGIVLTPHK